MSRIGKRPIPLPTQVSVEIKGAHISVKGPKGTLERDIPAKVIVAQDGDAITVTREDESRTARERHGLVRTLVANMVNGVTNGFERRLEIQGLDIGLRPKGQN